MKTKIFNIVVVFALLLTFVGASFQVASAGPAEAASEAVIAGSVRCGTLKGWGVWRDTASIQKIYRTVYFEPERVGTHRINFYLNGFRGVMTPYWSNDGGKTWNSWSWNSSGGIIQDEMPWITYYTVNLRTDTTKTIYKFVFFSDYPGYVTYRFYCQ